MRLIIGLLLVLVVACGSGEAERSSSAVIDEPLTEQNMTAAALTTAIAASAEPPYDPALLLTELETAVSLWNSQEIQGYQVTVNYRQPTWNTQKILLTVEDGIIIDSEHSCFPKEDCILQTVDPELLTIEALFQTVETVISLNDPETQINFNPTYGYPNAIIYEDASWVTDGFQLLENE